MDQNSYSTLNLCDLKTIRQVMAMFSLNFKKEFGQNFLTDNMVVEDIADMCCDYTAKTVLEIGPGIGSLTQELAKRYENVVAFEIDRGLIPVLKYTPRYDAYKSYASRGGSCWSLL